MLLSIKRKLSDGLLLAADLAGLLGSAAGASVVAFFGKLALAIVLAAVALGFFLRLSGRRRVRVEAPAPLPAWCSAASVVLSCVEVALLVEATDLPVRFSQAGFEYYHWVFVIAALAVAFVVHMQIFRALVGRRNVSLPQP
jgi:uncharacterized membrane protein